ncbi:MAG: DNA gyrase inhibitor YacG [Acidobacteria bacterium]|nr:DNA gyrase inhibitor YacG [Acidobacteriota bacterium]
MPDGSTCVYCRQRPASSPWRPFCSERCHLADLGRWLQGDYLVVADHNGNHTEDDFQE